MPATMFAATDTTVADFGAGTLDGQISIAQTADGEVILSPAAGSEFPGAALPPDWSTTAWAPGGAATVSGRCAHRRRRAGGDDRDLSGRPIARVRRHVQRGAVPARRLRRHVRRRAVGHVQHGGGRRPVRAHGFGQRQPRTHRSPARCSGRRIASGSTGRRPSVTYSVDGAVVATHAIAIGAPMRPLVSDFAAGTGVVTVDWMRMSPYASAGTFLSRVFDAGTAVNWGTLSWTAQAPPGAGAAFVARHGDTPVAGCDVDGVRADLGVGRRHRRQLAISAVPRRSGVQRSRLDAVGRAGDDRLLGDSAESCAGRGGRQLQRDAGYVRSRLPRRACSRTTPMRTAIRSARSW